MENILKIPSGSNLGSEFSFHLPTRIVFGSGTLQNIGKQTRRLGSKAFLVTAKDTMREMGILDQVVQNLREEGVIFEIMKMLNLIHPQTPSTRGLLYCDPSKQIWFLD